MKLSKSKLALAKVINENGGWAAGDYAAMDKEWHGRIFRVGFYQSKPQKPSAGRLWWMPSDDHGVKAWAEHGKTTPNWHQTALSSEEYYQAYPKADADGWIEWQSPFFGEMPVGENDVVDIRVGDDIHTGFVANNWKMWGVVTHYRLHKSEVRPEFCESVTRSIQEPEEIFSESASIPHAMQCGCNIVDAKPTIEQLAQSYRNAKDYAERLQKEADEAAKEADAKLGELERAGEAIGLVIDIAKPDPEPELVITDWRELQVGDIVFIDSMRRKSEWSSAMVGRECSVVEDGIEYPICFVNDFTPEGQSYWVGGADDGDIDWRFIRRP